MFKPLIHEGNTAGGSISSDEIQGMFARLEYEWDGRNPPDNLRKGRFRNGWEDAAVRGQEYSVETLRRLTWHNLGYRFGRLLGQRSGDEIDNAYEILAAAYQRPADRGSTLSDEQQHSREGDCTLNRRPSLEALTLRYEQFRHKRSRGEDCGVATKPSTRVQEKLKIVDTRFDG